MHVNMIGWVTVFVTVNPFVKMLSNPSKTRNSHPNGYKALQDEKFQRVHLFTLLIFEVLAIAT